jgi:uncharacterized protein (TIGR03067 family)
MLLSSATTFLGLLLAGAGEQPDTQPEVQPGPKEVPFKKELARFQGTWQLEHLEENGKKSSGAALKGRSLFFGRDTFLFRLENNLIQLGMLKIDPTKSPKTFNAVVMRGPQKGDALLGIYTLEGDTLKVCLSLDGDERPKEFSAPEKSGRALMTCKRIRGKDEAVDLSGTYRSESTELDGTRAVAEVEIERMGDAYLVTYNKRGVQASYIGIGLRTGNVFCMAWLSGGQAGVTMYTIESGHRLVGRYSQLGGPGIVSEEILTRTDYK